MSQPCAITKCIRASRGLCDCCKQNLCLQHLNEHNASLLSQLNPLTDEINALGDRLKTINIQKIVDGGRQKLEQWRVDCHQKIEHFFELKCQQLDQLIDEKVTKQKKEVNRLQTKVAELIREEETTRQDIDSLTSTIRHLETQMNNIEQIYFEINIRSFVIDDSSIDIKEMHEHEIDLSTLPQPCKTIKCPPGSKMVLACNERHLLIHQKPNLCLIDGQMNIVKKILYSDDKLFSPCWSATLNRFVMIGEDSVYLLDEEAELINVVQTIEKQCLSCTCSDTFLFLSTNQFGSSIMQFSLLPSIKLIRESKSPHTCAEDELIHDIVYRNETLALIIANKSDNSIRMELRSVETLDRIWLLRPDILTNKQHML